jgi:hypothetical protein
VSVVPGLLLHGAGQAALGQWPAARSLFEIELAGAGMAGTGALAFWYSGASRQLVGTATAFTVAGLGVLAITWLADLYGVLAPPGGTGAPSRMRPLLEAGAGYRYVYDPRFSYRSLAGASLDLGFRAFSFSASAWTALDAGNQRLRGSVAYRILGPRHDVPADDGSFVDVSLAATHHAYQDDGFSLTLGEAFALGRLDFGRLGPTLRGAYGELGAGWALGAYAYTHAGSEATALLLMRAAFGIYLGTPGKPHGQIALVYDHRHDDFAGGLSMPGIVSGVFGHYGVEGSLYVTPRWGITAEVQVGSAALAGLSVRYRVPGGKEP